MQRECDKNTAVAEEAMQAAVYEVETALKEARDTIQDLSDQKVVLESELTEKEFAWQDKTDRLRTQLAEANDALRKAKSEESAGARETCRRLQNEYETKVAALERRTQAKLSRVRAHFCRHSGSTI